MLRDLTIKNYRMFKDFTIERLARVNLIVGANNSGKTSFLEAVYLLCGQDDKNALPNLLHTRGEYVEFSNPSNLTEYQYLVTHLFRGHQPQAGTEGVSGSSFIIETQTDRPLGLHARLRLPTPPDPGKFAEYLRLRSPDTFGGAAPFELQFKYSVASQTVQTVNHPVTDDYFIRPGFLRFSGPFVPRNFITANALDFMYLARLWDEIALTSEEEKVLEALRILEPDVEGIRFTSRQTSNSGVVIKLRNQLGPIPLGSMGEGMRRILTLAMFAVTAQDDVLLVDEIDTGLYHGAQTDMWRLMIETAQRLNVQIFATTHSWDSVAAFQEALNQHPGNEIGRLFRLEARDGDIRSVRYDADDLAIAVRQAIEVR